MSGALTNGEPLARSGGVAGVQLDGLSRSGTHVPTHVHVRPPPLRCRRTVQRDVDAEQLFPHATEAHHHALALVPHGPEHSPCGAAVPPPVDDIRQLHALRIGWIEFARKRCARCFQQALELHGEGAGGAAAVVGVGAETLAAVAIALVAVDLVFPLVEQHEQQVSSDDVVAVGTVHQQRCEEILVRHHYVLRVQGVLEGEGVIHQPPDHVVRHGEPLGPHVHVHAARNAQSRHSVQCVVTFDVVEPCDRVREVGLGRYVHVHCARVLGQLCSDGQVRFDGIGCAADELQVVERSTHLKGVVHGLQGRIDD